ncbi:MAG: hypothetical protein ACTSXP_14935 [Promethearchaeota archaeon]
MTRPDGFTTLRKMTPWSRPARILDNMMEAPRGERPGTMLSRNSKELI